MHQRAQALDAPSAHSEFSIEDFAPEPGAEADLDPDARIQMPQPSRETETGLETLIDAVEQIAGVLPERHEVIAAICDPAGHPSDLVVREEVGETHLVLGLSAEQQARLAPLLSQVRDVAGTPPRNHGRRSVDQSAPASEWPDGSVDVFYRTIVEECPVPLIVLDHDGCIEYASPGVVPNLGMPDPAELAGVDFAHLLHPADRPRLASLSMRRLRHSLISVRLRRWDGSFVNVDIVARVVREPERLILALGPTSGHRSHFEEVLSAERRQRSLADAADCGTALVHADVQALGSIIDANAAFGRIARATPGEIAGRAIWDLVAAPDAPRVRDAVRHVATGEGSRRLELRLAADAHRRAEFVLEADRSSGDPPLQLTVRVRDITEHQSSVDELEREVDRLEQDNRELTEFARVTAHDLMSPLRAISGLVDLLAPSLEEQAEDALTAVQTAIGRMLAMVDGAMGFTAAQAPQLDRSRVDLGRVLGHVQRTLATEITATNARLRSADLPTVMGVESQIERVLLCLLTNALAYSGDRPPEIEIRAHREADMWRISVADQGIGVESDARERIFNLFERDTGTGAGRFRGIGLATCRRIVELHDGSIWVQPNMPCGSIFCFTLPASA